jgi:cytochrome P450
MPTTYKKLTGPRQMPLVGNMHQFKIDKMHLKIEEWADQYGEVYKVALGPTRATVVTSPSIIQQILKARPHQFRRMAKMDGVLQEAGVRGVFNVEGEEWKAHRRIVATGLDVKHQQQFFPAMLKSVQHLKERWDEAASTGQSDSIQQDLMRFTVDVTTMLAFGYEMNTLVSEGDVIQEHLEKIFPTIFKRINAPIPTWRWIKRKTDKEFDHAVAEVFKLIDEFIAAAKNRLDENPELKERPTNFLEGMLVAAMEEESITDDDVRSNVITMLLAGEDTTAHTIAWVIFYLCKYPHVQKKLQEEADACLQNDSWLADYSKAKELPYLEAVAYETMRLKPVAPILLFNALEDVEMEDYLFKKGSNILIETRHSSMQCPHFKQPTDFSPERWIVNGKQRKSEGHNLDAYMPFGSGPRFCPGKNLAILEMKLVLSMLAKNFTLEMITPEEDLKEIMAFTMMPSAFKVKITARS